MVNLHDLKEIIVQQILQLRFNFMKVEIPRGGLNRFRMFLHN